MNHVYSTYVQALIRLLDPHVLNPDLGAVLQCIRHCYNSLANSY